MIIKTMTYTDYNGVKRTETFHFNLTKAEIIEMELGTDGTLSDALKKMVDAVDAPLIMSFLKKIILKSYGEKTPDGRQLVKGEEVSKAFSQTEAFSDLYVQLVTDADAAAEFINGIMPQTDDRPKPLSIAKVDQ